MDESNVNLTATSNKILERTKKSLTTTMDKSKAKGSKKMRNMKKAKRPRTIKVVHKISMAELLRKIPKRLMCKPNSKPNKHKRGKKKKTNKKQKKKTKK